MDAIVAGRDERPLPLGVMRRGLSYHLEMRTGSRGCKKVHSANFGQDRELVGISHDVARLCILGETKFLGLQKNQLNHWEDRYLIAQKFSGDPRMIGLAEDHRKKDRDHLNWDPGMKKRLHALTLDVHKLIKSEAQEEAAAPQQAPAVHNQNSNGDVIPAALGDEESPFDIDSALCIEGGADLVNWACTIESLQRIIPMFPYEIIIALLHGEIGRLEAENNGLRARLGEIARVV